MSLEFNQGVHFSDSLPASQRGKVIGLGVNARKMYVGDAKVHDANFAFLSTTLAKLHTKTYTPKVWFTYAKDVPVDTGGGFVDYVEYFTVDWAGIMNDTRNIFGNNGNLIPRINASMTQNRVPVFTYEIAYDLRFIELEKMKQLTLQKSIEKIYQEGILAGWDYFVQRVAYLGISNSNGLFNSTNVLVGSIDNSATSGEGFEGLTDAEVVGFFNGVFILWIKRLQTFCNIFNLNFRIFRRHPYMRINTVIMVVMTFFIMIFVMFIAILNQCNTF